MDEERHAWDRLDKEPTHCYQAFRQYRDLGPLRTLEALHGVVDTNPRNLRAWCAQWDWRARAGAWDDHVHMAEDAARVEDIRAMHSRHAQAGRAAVAMALSALESIDPGDVTAASAARLMELGAKLERDTLTVSVESLQGRSSSAVNDPWEELARQLTGEGEGGEVVSPPSPRE